MSRYVFRMLLFVFTDSHYFQLIFSYPQDLFYRHFLGLEPAISIGVLIFPICALIECVVSCDSVLIVGVVLPGMLFCRLAIFPLLRVTQLFRPLINMQTLRSFFSYPALGVELGHHTSTIALQI